MHIFNTALLQQALLIIIQLVSEPILAQIASLRTAHEMWVYLRENYFSDTYFSFVHQMRVLFSLESANKSVTEFIRVFETEWSRLRILASNTGHGSRYRSLMQQVLDEDEAKRDWLLLNRINQSVP